MESVYPVYVQTYEAVADALRRDDVRALRSAWLAAAFHAGPAAVAAAAAQVDAVNRVPMCSSEHLRRVVLESRCSPDC